MESHQMQQPLFRVTIPRDKLHIIMSHKLAPNKY